MPYKHFKMHEFACPCCGENLVSTKLIEKLDTARHLAGVAFKINSGYRCEKHNKEVGGKETSSHLKGLAVDIACTNSVARFKLLNALLIVGFKRIGIADTFIHCDIDSSKVQDVIWSY
jgi:zinc D-Ala-D-Ala carboxypeptidase